LRSMPQLTVVNLRATRVTVEGVRALEEDPKAGQLQFRCLSDY
jgi:hypothetical protein